MNADSNEPAFPVESPVESSHDPPKSTPDVPVAAPPPATHSAAVSAKPGRAGLPEAAKYSISFLIIAAAIAAFIGLKSLAKSAGTKTPDVLIPEVVVQPARKHIGTIDLVVSGTVVAHNEISLAAEVGGRVKEKFPECLAGTFVKKGTPLVQLDPESYQLELNTVSAELEQADKRMAETDKQIVGENKNLKIANSDMAIQRREFERLRRAGSAISRSELDQARRSLNAAQSEVTARSNAIESLGATRETLLAGKKLTNQRLKRAQLDLRRTLIKAPEDGVIVSEAVQKDDFVRQGDLIAVFENTSMSEVRCNLTTTDLDWIRLNSKDSDQPRSIYELPKTNVLIYDAEEPDVIWNGTLERFSGIGRDPVTKTTPCRILVSQPIIEGESGQRALVRGMYVKCRIEVQTSAADESNDLIAFSEKALQPNNDVWIVRNEKLEKATVEVVDRTNADNPDTGKSENVIVARVLTGQLKAGDSLVVSPISQPTTGTKIIVFDPGNEEKSAPEKAGQMTDQMTDRTAGKKSRGSQDAK